MKRIILFLCVFLFGITSYAKEEPKQLYAQSAVLMDADSGRVLFEKNGYEAKAMASTTKIMTCILALENGDLDRVVTASEHAVKQPKVHLGMQNGEHFYMKDLLYSLMLESHNDSAVAIAESVGGTVEGFAKMMNQKATEIGCEKTYFITPNGLDATDEKGKHSTSAVDLAKIMRYCIEQSVQKELFLKISQTQNHTFTNTDGNRNFSCHNHNAFLGMMEGAISGKTGFTGDAGYCYVGALKRDGRTFIVSLLGCGWPNNKGYKWKDTRTLMEYGIQNYTYRNVFRKQKLPIVPVEDGIPQSGNLFDTSYARMRIDAQSEELLLLLSDEEVVDVKVEIRKHLEAPLRFGEKVGNVTYYLENKPIRKYPIVIMQSISKKTFVWYFQNLIDMYMIK